MSTPIFAIDAENRLIRMQQADYDSEDFFQQILADHPDLLGLGGGADGCLLLVRRELSVPDQQDGSGRWSIDHLFIDRAGVPVLVEVKRASDTRARREVVAQMLDYAANGIAFWPIEHIVAGFEASATQAGQSPDAVLADFVGEQGSEDFWRQVEANLRSGRIRMVFVADRIPRELARIVEFLNEQMRPAEVIAIEVAQFVGDNGTRTLVPKLVGATERAVSAKAVSAPREPMSVEEWLAALESSVGAAARSAAEGIIEWLEKAGFDVGVSVSTDSLSASVQAADGKRAWPFFLRRSTGRFEVALQYLKSTDPYRPDVSRAELLGQLIALDVPFSSTGKLTGWPSLTLEQAQVELQRGGLGAIVIEIRDSLIGKE